jgi:hypothetical protein
LRLRGDAGRKRGCRCAVGKVFSRVTSEYDEIRGVTDTSVAFEHAASMSSSVQLLDVRDKARAERITYFCDRQLSHCGKQECAEVFVVIIR